MIIFHYQFNNETQMKISFRSKVLMLLIVTNKTERLSKNRISFCTMDFFDKDTPLLPSGLIGPVQIMIESTWNINDIK